MECSCLDIDIHLLDKCAGRRIKIDVKVSHFGMFRERPFDFQGGGGFFG